MLTFRFRFSQPRSKFSPTTYTRSLSLKDNMQGTMANHKVSLITHPRLPQAFALVPGRTKRPHQVQLELCPIALVYGHLIHEAHTPK